MFHFRRPSRGAARLSTVANRAIQVVGPQIWNDLPADVTYAVSNTEEFPTDLSGQSINQS